MNYIINPWVFYWLGVAGNLGVTATVISILTAIGGCAFLVFYLVCRFDGWTSEKKAKQWDTMAKVASKVLISVFLILSLLAVFTPSKETCYQMLAASVITEENIQAVGEAGKNIVDYIVESVDTLLEEGEDD